MGNPGGSMTFLFVAATDPFSSGLWFLGIVSGYLALLVLAFMFGAARQMTHGWAFPAAIILGSIVFTCLLGIFL